MAWLALMICLFGTMTLVGIISEAMKIIRRAVPLNWNQVRPAGLASYAQCKVVHL